MQKKYLTVIDYEIDKITRKPKVSKCLRSFNIPYSWCKNVVKHTVRKMKLENQNYLVLLLYILYYYCRG